MSTSLLEQKARDEVVGLDVLPLTPRIGATVLGVDLSRPLHPEVLEAVRGALLRWKVLFFRDQDVDHAEHVALANQLGGALYAHPFDDGVPPATYPMETRVAGFPELYRVDHRGLQSRRVEGISSTNSANSFWGLHIDRGASVNPPSISILRSEIVPEYGGDTIWFDSVAAYEGLSRHVRDFVDALWAEHEHGTEFGTYRGASIPEHSLALHPVVRLIPETGERALFVTPRFTKRIRDVSADESQWVLNFLYTQLTRPGYSVRFKWERGDLAISDNRTTTHIGPQDLGPDVDRILLLAEVEGSPPYSIDGWASTSTKGVPRRRSKSADPNRPHFL
jgi:alpha-ketoglutarate-dependent sulfate ester dioxygenase